MIKQVRVRLEEDLHTQVKSRAALERMTLDAWIEAAVRAQMAQPLVKRSVPAKPKGSEPVK